MKEIEKVFYLFFLFFQRNDSQESLWKRLNCDTSTKYLITFHSRMNKKKGGKKAHKEPSVQKCSFLTVITRNLVTYNWEQTNVYYYSCIHMFAFRNNNVCKGKSVRELLTKREEESIWIDLSFSNRFSRQRWKIFFNISDRIFLRKLIILFPKKYSKLNKIGIANV